MLQTKHKYMNLSNVSRSWRFRMPPLGRLRPNFNISFIFHHQSWHVWAVLYCCWLHFPSRSSCSKFNNHVISYTIIYTEHSKRAKVCQHYQSSLWQWSSIQSNSFLNFSYTDNGVNIQNGYQCSDTSKTTQYKKEFHLTE